MLQALSHGPAVDSAPVAPYAPAIHRMGELKGGGLRRLELPNLLDCALNRISDEDHFFANFLRVENDLLTRGGRSIDSAPLKTSANWSANLAAIWARFVRRFRSDMRRTVPRLVGLLRKHQGSLRVALHDRGPSKASTRGGGEHEAGGGGEGEAQAQAPERPGGASAHQLLCVPS